MDVMNVLLLFLELTVYFAVMAGLFRLRHRLGIGIFFCALGAMHFLETYLAAILYVPFAEGTAISPGSTVLFAGKLVLLLLVYIREDASTVRQPIYGLLIGNFLTVALVFLARHHIVAPATGQLPDFSFMNDMGWLMVWGTVLLFVDSILIILLYERLGRIMRQSIGLRIALCAMVVLTFDQIGFYSALWALLDAPIDVLVGGWLAKMVTACIYGVLAWFYLRYLERPPLVAPRQKRISDIFDILTYRERYEDLLKRVGRDELTGVFDRSRLPGEGKDALNCTPEAGRPFSVLVVDIDEFKAINDDFGHACGDLVLKEMAATMQGVLRKEDVLVRYGGDEFVICCNDLDRWEATSLGDRLMRRVAALQLPPLGRPVTVSIGHATSPDEGRTFEELFAAADRSLYRAKRRRHGESSKLRAEGDLARDPGVQPDSAQDPEGLGTELV